MLQIQVHFIFRHKNPITGEFEEKHLKTPPKPKIEKLTNLYTLIVKSVSPICITFTIRLYTSSALITRMRFSSTENLRAPVAFLRTSTRQSTLRRKLTIRMTSSPTIGSPRRRSLIRKPRSPRIGTRMPRMKSKTLRPRSLRAGLTMSLRPFRTQVCSLDELDFGNCSQSYRCREARGMG